MRLSPAAPQAELLKHRQIWLMALIYAGASSAGTTLSVWSPQLLKSFHLDNPICFCC
jgi:ACS family tartrate transporter-like MFS transporter